MIQGLTPRGEGVQTSSMTKRCKTPTGSRPDHSYADTPHNSIPNVTLVACTACGKVKTWKAA